MKILFLGHEDFGNRGCEALIRSIVQIVQERVPEAQFLLPSRTPAMDREHWPQLSERHVSLVGETLFARHLGWWGRIAQKLPALISLGCPPFKPDAATMAALHEADQVIITGGDIISLEYGLPSLYFWVGMAEWARRLDKPVHLWGASVGPFTANPQVEQQMARHLSRCYNSISVRESSTRDYLAKLGVPDVQYVADPAFHLKPEPHSAADALFAVASNGVLGLNVSPLVRTFLKDEKARRAFDAEIMRFLRHVALERGMPVLLVPHVDPYDGTSWNSDGIYMKGLMQAADLPADKLMILPSDLNAAQLKHSLSRCRFFIGARTHATIGAISQGVPTVSIAYSVKAVGINRDLFGDREVVLPTPKVSFETLNGALDRLIAQETDLRTIIAEKMPVWRERGRIAADPIVTRVRA